MMVGVDSNGKYQEVKTNEDGNLEIVMAGEETETTSSASIQTIGTTATSISVNKKVTSIDIANYSETANVTVGIDGSNYVIGANLATTLVINKDVTNISLTSTEDNTTVQIIVKEGKSGGSAKSFPPDWTEIGYEYTPSGVMDGFNYAKEIQNNWDASITNMLNKYRNDYNLLIYPLVDTSNVTNMQQAFHGCNNLINIPKLNTSRVTNMHSMFISCSALKTCPELDTSNAIDLVSMFEQCSQLVSIPLFDTRNATTMQNMFMYCLSLEFVPQLDTSKVTNMQNMFNGCGNLTDESLKNILNMCINATLYTGTKTLSNMGFNATNYPVSRIQALPNYQAFLDAGWTIGY